LAYFVAVAEELHFGRAAERLGMAQPPLSRAIGLLERRIGVRLLDRTSRRVTLTPAGEVFLVESRKVLDAADAAARRAQQASGSRALILAVRPGAGAGILSDLLDSYGRCRDAVPVDIVFTHDQVAALRAGTADVAVICGSADLADLRTVLLVEESPIALLPAGHHLANRSEVTLAEVRQDETFQASCPTIGLDEIIDLVSLRRLIVVVGDSVSGRLGTTVSAVTVSDLPGTLLMLAWTPHIPSPQLTAFIDNVTTTIVDRDALHRQAS
jgi:DNA-binding transcriptional LysR family regulator